MNIRQDGLTARTYRVAQTTWFQFWYGERWRSELLKPHTTNLCTLVRTIIVAAPLAILVNVAVWGALVFTVVQLVYGLVLLLAPHGWTLTVVFLCMAGLILFVWLATLSVRYGARAASKVAERTEVWRVVRTYVRAKKDRLCPIVTMGDQP